VHEVLGVARGNAVVRFGGDNGTELALAPATSRSCPPAPGINACLQARTFPSSAPIRRPAGRDHAATPDNHARALKTIPHVKLPKTIRSRAWTDRW